TLLGASIEKLTAEKRRRIEEKIAKGLAVRREWPIVVGVPDPERDFCAVTIDEHGREGYPPEDCAVIATGVPRKGPDVGLGIPASEPRNPVTPVPQGKMEQNRQSCQSIDGVDKVDKVDGGA